MNSSPRAPASRGRVALVALGVTALLALVFLYLPHWILTALPAPGRDARALLASAWSAGALVLAGAAMRRVTVRGRGIP
ncbi:MAG: hypothetical protein MUF21_05730 [Gemmatimonadaceae bacterium]|jgi:hypothetical protein|nr:hypothetical protein [Gemmatimonadaceae bacterium]